MAAKRFPSTAGGGQTPPRRRRRRPGERLDAADFVAFEAPEAPARRDRAVRAAAAPALEPGELGEVLRMSIAELLAGADFLIDAFARMRRIRDAGRGEAKAWARERDNGHPRPPPPPASPPAADAQQARAIFGLGPRFTRRELVARFRELVKVHHPDQGGDPKMFRRVLDAYKVLEPLAAKEP